MDAFVIRLWEPSDDIAIRDLRGTVRCVRTGAEAVFRDAPELVNFIEANRRAPDGLDR